MKEELKLFVGCDWGVSNWYIRKFNLKNNWREMKLWEIYKKNENLDREGVLGN